MKLIRKIVIKDYPLKIKLSDKRRKKYYVKGKKIPKTYLGPKYTFDKQGFVINKETGEKVIANPRSYGTPNYQAINGQKLHNASMHMMTRNKVMHLLKDFFIPHLNNLPVFTEFPLIIEGEMFRPLSIHDNWDVDNIQALYVKAFHDAMMDSGLIPDDKARYVSGPLSFLLTPSDEHKFIIKFYHDDRTVWKDFWDKF